jgi:hypothetical protein
MVNWDGSKIWHFGTASINIKIPGFA